MNKVIISGNICKDIELKKTQSGKEVVSNTIAVKRNFKDIDGNYPSDFIPFVAWGNQATFLSNYTSKGDCIGIVGRWQNREYEDKNGNKRTVSEVIVEEVNSFSKSKEKKEKTQDEYLDEECPF